MIYFMQSYSNQKTGLSLKPTVDIDKKHFSYIASLGILHTSKKSELKTLFYAVPHPF